MLRALLAASSYVIRLNVPAEPGLWQGVQLVKIILAICSEYVTGFFFLSQERKATTKMIVMQRSGYFISVYQTTYRLSLSDLDFFTG